MLSEIHTSYGYLSEKALRQIADVTGCSLVDIYGVVTFYRSFSLKPRGKHICSVCTGTACHVRNAPGITEEFERQLKIKAGQTTRDKTFTLETVNCLGTCALGPIVVVDGQYHADVSIPEVKKIINRTRRNSSSSRIKPDNRIFPVTVSCSHCNHSLMDKTLLVDDYPSIKVTASFGRKHGWLRLSSLYGSYHVESEFEVPEREVVHFFCPHCHTEMAGAVPCPDCEAPMVTLLVRDGGVVQICSRRGCKYHMLDINGAIL